MKKSSTQVSEKAGVTDFCYLKDGSILAAGQQGAIMVINEKSEEKSVILELDSGVNSLAYTSMLNLVAVGTDDMRVLLYRFSSDSSSLEFEAQLGKFAAPVTSVLFTAGGAVLFAAAQSGFVKRFDVHAQKETASMQLHANGAVRGLTVDPSGSFLATAGSDGEVRVWTLESLGDALGPNMVHSLKGVLPLVGGAAWDGRSSMLHMAWHPSGSHLAVPCGDGQIRCFSVESWAMDFALFREGHDAASHVSIVRFSPNGAYLASSSGREVIVWDVRQKTACYNMRAGDAVCSLRWSAKRNEVTMCSADGHLQRWSDVVSEKHHVHPAHAVEGATVPEKTAEDLANAMFPPDEEEEEEEEHQQPSATKDTDRTPFKEDDDDDEVQLEDEEEQASLAQLSHQLAERFSAEQPVVVDFDEGRFCLRRKQEAFQPSASSPLSNRRVLVWNRVGRVISVADRLESVVEVEFADVSRYRKMRVNDLYSYTMCGLSDAGVALAAQRNVEAGTHAMIHFKPVTGSRRGSEWQQLLSPEEEVMGVAVGRSWVAAVTAPYGYLRVWLPSGLQQLPLQLPSASLVCSVGDGDQLALFFNDPSGCLLVLYDMARRVELLRCAAPVTAQAELTWAGFTPDGILVTLDSAGVARCVVHEGAWRGQWVPLSQPEGEPDTSRRYPLGFPIGATLDALIVIRLSEQEELHTGLVLDEDNRGTPLIDTLRWCSPLVGLNSGFVSGLEGVLRQRLMLQLSEPDARKQLEIDTEVIKLISLAAKNDHSTRVIDLFLTLQTGRARDVAIRWCDTAGYGALAQTLQNISSRLGGQQEDYSSRSEEGDDMEEGDDDDEVARVEETPVQKQRKHGEPKRKHASGKNPFQSSKKKRDMQRSGSGVFATLLSI